MSFKTLDKRDRLFRRGTIKEKTSLSLHKPIFDTLKILCERSGDSMSDIVTDILDQYLTAMHEQGFIDKPTDDVTPEVVVMPEFSASMEQKPSKKDGDAG